MWTHAPRAAGGARSSDGSGLREAPLLYTYAMPPKHMTDVAMVAALLASDDAPTDLVGFERSGAVRDRLVAEKRKAMSCDTRPCESSVEGWHYQGRVQDIVDMADWERFYAFPECTHLAASDTTCGAAKARDGRRWWGLAMVLWCLCVAARSIVVEQPKGAFPAASGIQPTQVIHPYHFGDDAAKETHLFMRGALPIPLDAQQGRPSHAWHSAAGGGEQGALKRGVTFPGVARALACSLPVSRARPRRLEYRVAVEAMAARWRTAQGAESLPWDYNTWDATPAAPERKEYQRQRGKGDGRAAREVAPMVRLEHDTPALVAACLVALPDRTPPLCAMPAGTAHACFGVPEGVAEQQRPSKRAVACTTRGAEVLQAVWPAATAELCYYGATVTLPTRTQAQVAVMLGPRTLEGERVCNSVAEREAADAQLAPGARIWCSVRALEGRCEQAIAAAAVLRAVEQTRPIAEGLAAKGAGAIEPRKVKVALTRSEPAADVAALNATYERELKDLLGRLQRRAASDEYLRSPLCEWIDRLTAKPTCPVPDSLLEAARRPPTERLMREPFRHGCAIHATEPIKPAVPQQVHTSMRLPHCWRDALNARARPEIEAALQGRERYHAARCRSGERGHRPVAESWSMSDAVYTQWQDLQLDYSLGPGRTRLLPVHMPALCTHLHLRAIREYFPAREFKNQRTVSMMLGGAVFQDDLPKQIVLTSNLHAMYEVEGGVDVVAAELHGLARQRRWYRVKPGGAGLVTTPTRINPRSATKRPGEIARPRGLAEMGAPRTVLRAHRTGELTPALNPSAGPMRHDCSGVHLLDPKWYTECKPTIEDAAANGAILQCAAAILGLALFQFAFDYKFFFHQLCYRMSEVWKCGFIIPDLDEAEKASMAMCTMLELVVAMGASPSSNICQDMANALMAKLLQLFDEADAPRVARLRRENQEFDEWMRAREELPHDDYGTHARLLDSLQYTDDHWACVVGAEGAETFLTVFHTFIGPAWVGEPTLQGMAAAEEAAERVAAAYEREYRAFAEREVAPPRVYWAEGQWANLVLPTPDEAQVQIRRGCGPWGERTSLPAGADPQQREECIEAFAKQLFASPSMVKRARRQLKGKTLGCTCQGQLCHGHVLAEVANCSSEQLSTLRRRYAPVAERGYSGGEAQAEAYRQSLAGSYLRTALQGDGKPCGGLNFEPAKAAKWHAGAAVRWVGGGLSPHYGLVWVPHEKAIVAVEKAQWALSDSMPATEYRRFVFYLQHLCFMVGGAHYRMRGLWRPLQAEQELEQGPDTPVKCDEEMRGRIKNWIHVLLNAPGCSALAAFDGVRAPGSGVAWVLRGDAALEGDGDPGMGGWFYGRWWRVGLSSDARLRHPAMTIPVLENITASINLIQYAPLLQRAQCVLVESDALATAMILQRGEGGGAGADEMAMVNEMLIATEEYKGYIEPTLRLDVRHTYGAANPLPDAISRAKFALLEEMCAALGIQPRRDELSAAAAAFLERCLRRITGRAAEAPTSPRAAAASSHRGKGFSDCTDGDGPRSKATSASATSAARIRTGIHGYPWTSMDSHGLDIHGYPWTSVDIQAPMSPRAAAASSHRGKGFSDCTDGDGPPSKTTSAPPPAPPARAAAGRSRTPMGLRLLTAAVASCARAAGGGGVLTPGGGGPPVSSTVAAAAVVAHAEQAACLSRRERYRSWAAARHRDTQRAQQGAALGAECKVELVHAERAHAPAARRTSVATKAEVEARLAVSRARAAVLASEARPSGVRAAEHTQIVRDAQQRRIEAAMQQMQHDRSELALRPSDPGLLRLLLERAAASTIRRTPLSVASLDASYWRFWCDWCRVMGTPPLRTDVEANRSGAPAEAALRIGAFMMWVITNPNFLPTSMLARLRGAARVHKACGYDFGPLTAVTEACRGATQEYLDEHGPHALTPKRKEPLTNEMLVVLMTLMAGVVPGFPGMVVGASLAWLGVRVFIALAAASGFRKADMALDGGVAFGKRHLSLFMVRWWIGGAWVERPTEAMKRHGFTREDRVHIIPPPSKADQDGTKWSASQVIVRYHPTAPVNLFRELAEYEIRRAVDGSETRQLTPLLLDEHGRHWTKQRLAAFFDALLTWVFGKERAKKHSVHSFRIYLACALRAAGASRELIMEMLRWSSDDALKLYARINSAEDADWRDRAAVAAVDSVRSGTLAAMRPAVGGAEERADLVERAAAADVASVDMAEVPQVDIDAAVGQIQAAQPRLEAAALQGDEDVRQATTESLQPLVEELGGLAV